jgi:uncharacterized protein
MRFYRASLGNLKAMLSGRGLHPFLRAFACAAACLLPASVAAADPPPAGSVWSEEFIQEADGTSLHADVLRPAGLPAGARTPVILSVGPYFNHSGQVGPAGPVEDASYTPLAEAGPSSRFFDFVDGAQLMKKGYTFAMVDLRGFGGSSGCLDWAGPGEQADVKAAVEWAASQPWSSGKVGMYGKSYDGVTGLIGVNSRPKGLAAVVSQEPVYDLYRYLYSNRVRFANAFGTPALYDGIAATPGTVGDTPQYNANALNDLARPGCSAQNWGDQQEPDPAAAYWQPRNLIPPAKGSKVPLFLTQGFLEDNTKPDGTWDYFNSVKGPKRAWLGMWDHVRGNDKDAKGRLAMGRKGWFDEVMRFYDRYLKGTRAKVRDPKLVVQSSDGRYRAESAWPPKDARTLTAALNAGEYVDSGVNNGSAEFGPPYGDGIWTISRPLTKPAHLAGIPRVTVDVEIAQADANLVVDVYDVDAKSSALLITRNAYLVPASGPVTMELYGQDWRFPKGHRVGVLVTSSNAEWWAHAPTGQTVAVRGGSLKLPFLRCKRTKRIQGDAAIKLDEYRDAAPFELDPAVVSGASAPKFPLPRAQKKCSHRR